MTDSEGALASVADAAALVPELAERLSRYGLAEIEVAHGDLRLRVAGSPAQAASVSTAASDAGEASRPMDTAPTSTAQSAEEARPMVGVPSPAVGFFVYADKLGPGLEVAKGDPLGHVEMLGVRHEVRAPRSGTISHLVAEAGEAVEYGQLVLEIEPAGARS